MKPSTPAAGAAGGSTGRHTSTSSSLRANRLASGPQIPSTASTAFTLNAAATLPSTPAARLDMASSSCMPHSSASSTGTSASGVGCRTPRKTTGACFAPYHGPTDSPRGGKSVHGSCDVDPAPGWSSSLLAIEVRLRELASTGPSEPPSIPRIEEVLTLYDSFASVLQCSSSSSSFGGSTVSAVHREILRLFRIEFCRAIFSGVVGVDVTNPATQADETQAPFFDKIDKMLRERNILQAELEASEKDHNVADLKRQLAKLQSLIPFYEQEVGRLSRENERHQEEIQRLKQDLDLTHRAHDKAFRTVEEEVRKLTTENRELQLQVFKLSKDNREQLTGQSMYHHLKQQRSDRLQAMFHTGDETAGTLLLCHQLENSLNTLLSEFDHNLIKAIPNEIPSLRGKLNKRVSLLLEEMHYCEARLAQLHGPQAKFLTLLKASSAYELEYSRLHRRHQQQQQPQLTSHANAPTGSAPLLGSNAMSLTSVKNSVFEASLAQSVRRTPQNANITVATESSAASHSPLNPAGLGASSASPLSSDAAGEFAAAQKRMEWVKHFLGSVVEHRDDADQPPSKPSGQTQGHAKGGPPLPPPQGGGGGAASSSSGSSGGSAVPAPAALSTTPEAFLQQIFVNPLLDVLNTKFMMSIDVHAYGGAPGSTLVKSINFVDPAAAIELPPKTTYVRLKFSNPQSQRFSAKGPADLASVSEVEVNAMGAAMEWSPLTARTQQAAVAEELQQRALLASKSPASPTVVTTSSGGGNATEPACWKLFRRGFRQYRPYLPRTLDVFHIDFIMMNACQRHMVRMATRYEVCRTTAQQRSTNAQMARVVAERLFRDEYDPFEFQQTLLEFLESRYTFPELVGKTLYELITSMESMVASAPQVQTYLDCIAGTTSCFSAFVCANILYALSSYWPVNLAFADQEVPAKDLSTVLRYIYPAESSVRVDLNALIADLQLQSSDLITLRNTKLFFVHSILAAEEPMLKKFRELFTYRAEVVQWSELEFADVFDVLKGYVGDENGANAVALFLESSIILQKTSRLPVPELCVLCASVLLRFEEISKGNK